MPITVQNYGNYGGNLINQKYRPIQNPDFAGGDRDDALAFSNQRINYLNNLGRFPGRLYFYTSGDWQNIVTTEEGANSAPPIVVVSSNRSGWINTGFQNGDNILGQLNIANFTDVRDVRAFNYPDGAADSPIPPWYFPKRVNDANRRTYILVHLFEYGKYRELLNDYNRVHVIGWGFAPRAWPVVAPNHPYAGFGASRYAAIEFCKLLRRTCNPSRWNHAWLVDDNLYYINSFRGFASAEGVTTANNYRAFGFGAGTSNDTVANIRQGNIAYDANNNTAYNPANTDGVLQQAVLWDIEWLDQQYLNFSPYFLASAEDTSFTNYLRQNFADQFRIATVSTIRKQEVNAHDNDVRGQAVNAARAHYEAEFAANLANRNGHENVRPHNGGNAVALRNYVVNTVLPASQLAAQAANAATQNRATTQAAEVIMAHAVTRAGFTPGLLFKPNGNNRQDTTVY